MAVLDVSAIDPGRSEQAHALTGVLTVNSARAIEERFFREHFHREWIVAIASAEEGAPGMLLAVDGNQRIVGANRVARTALLLDDAGLQAGLSLWTISERNDRAISTQGHDRYRHAIGDRRRRRHPRRAHDAARPDRRALAQCCERRPARAPTPGYDRHP